MEVVLEYVNSMNRPLNATNVGDALSTRGVKKGLAQRYLDQLADAGKIAFKEAAGKSTQKVYYPLQSEDVMSADELRDLSERTRSVMEEVGAVNAEVQALKSTLQSLRSAESVEAMADSLRALEAENAELEAKLKPLRAAKANGDVITEAERIKIENQFLSAMETWIDRRKKFNNLFDAVLEGTGGVKKKLWEDIGAETEKDVNIDYDKYRKIFDDLKRTRLIEARQKRFKK